MTLGPQWCVIKMKKGRKLQKTALSAVGSWSMARLKDSLLTVGGAALSQGPCWQFICALCTYILYIHVSVHVCVCCRQRGSCSEMRGEVESVGFRRDLKCMQATEGGFRPGEVSTTVLSHHQVLVLNLSRDGGELRRWNYGAISSEKTCTHWHVETESVQPSGYSGGRREKQQNKWGNTSENNWTGECEVMKTGGMCEVFQLYINISRRSVVSYS